ncbi:GL18234 [Drosophila persimilis]|uniref:GL18234 n=1 Tax=Drosophila persimilis TaxID=7234 RepID=B4H4H1_DROPE|nr:GL18234 [Drosophila persimilis]
MTPFDDFVYLINHVLLGEEPTIEDFILLVGTLVAFIAFILWCCFPIQPKEPGPHRQFTCKIIQNPIKAFDAATSTDDNMLPMQHHSLHRIALEQKRLLVQKAIPAPMPA